MTQHIHQEIMDKIRLWLKEVPGANIERVANPEIPSDCKIFKVSVTGDEPRVILSHDSEQHTRQITLSYFIALADREDVVKISTYFYFNEYDSISFRLLQTPDKVRFVNNMKIPIMMLNLGYTWVPDLSNFESLELSKNMYFDGFSKNVYFESVQALMHGYEIVKSKYDEFILSRRSR